MQELKIIRQSVLVDLSPRSACVTPVYVYAGVFTPTYVNASLCLQRIQGNCLQRSRISDETRLHFDFENCAKVKQYIRTESGIFYIL